MRGRNDFVAGRMMNPHGGRTPEWYSSECMNATVLVGWLHEGAADRIQRTIGCPTGLVATNLGSLFPIRNNATRSLPHESPQGLHAHRTAGCHCDYCNPHWSYVAGGTEGPFGGFLFWLTEKYASTRHYY